MSENGKPQTPKVDPETLVLRAAPRRVVRFKRNLLIGIAGVAVVAIFAATWLALGQAHFAHHENDQELPNTGQKRMPDAMAALPSSYSSVKLGAPLPGDLGPSVVDREKSLGIRPADTSFKPNPEDDAVRAERMRLAQEARQADQAGRVLSDCEQDERRNGNNLNGGMARRCRNDRPAGDANAASALSLDPTRDPNAQGRKLDVLNGKSDNAIYNPHRFSIRSRLTR